MRKYNFALWNDFQFTALKVFPNFWGWEQEKLLNVSWFENYAAKHLKEFNTKLQILSFVCGQL